MPLLIPAFHRRCESNGEMEKVRTPLPRKPMLNRHSKAATTLTNLSAHGMEPQIIDWSRHGISEKIEHKTLKKVGKSCISCPVTFLRTARHSSCRRINLSQQIFTCGKSIAATEVPSQMPLFAKFRCPMKNRTDCPCCIKTIEPFKSLELHFLGEHDEQCHAVDKSAYLKVRQIVAIVDGVKFAPQQSATALRWNMAMCAASSPEKAIDPKLLRSVQHRVKTVRQEITLQRLF
jgi:hypothetical protein